MNKSFLMFKIVDYAGEFFSGRYFKKITHVLRCVVDDGDEFHS